MDIAVVQLSGVYKPFYNISDSNFAIMRINCGHKWSNIEPRSTFCSIEEHDGAISAEIKFGPQKNEVGLQTRKISLVPAQIYFNVTFDIEV